MPSDTGGLPPSSGDTPSGAAGESDFDRQLRELTEGTAGKPRFHEPSAAQRARKARKLRPTARTRRRRARPGRPARPASRSQRSVAKVLAVACFLGLFVAVTWLGRHDLGKVVARSPGATSGPVSSQSATVTDPFSGTPAEKWADGSAGIVRPATRRVGSYSAAQVRAAYSTTRKLLIAVALNQKILHGGSPAAFARLLISSERSYFLRHLSTTRLSRNGASLSTRGWVLSFAPGISEFDGATVKVHGWMRASAAVSRGTHVLKVHADYLFVYPMLLPGEPSSLTRVVARRVVNVLFARWDDPGGRLEAYWVLEGGGVANALCGMRDGFIHPAFPESAPGTAAPSGPAIDPYSQPPLPRNPPSCQRITGT